MIKKIQIIITDYGNGLDIGYTGGTVRLYELIKALVKDGGFNITVVFSPGGYESFRLYHEKEPEILASIKTIFVRSSFFIKKNPFVLFLLYSYIISFFHFLLMIRSKKFGCYDIAYSSNDFWSSIIPIKYMKKKKKVRVIMADSFHIYPKPEERPGNYFINWAMYHLQRYSFNIISKYYDELFILKSLSGEKIFELIKDLGYPHEPHYIEAGMNLERIKKINKSNKEFHIISIGLRVSKGIYDLPEILIPVFEERPDVLVGLIGEIALSDKEYLVKEFKKSGFDQNVIFCGRLSDEEKFAYLKSSKIFIATSHEEGWGIAVGEGMACGLPVVSYDLPAYRSVYRDSIVYTSCFNKSDFAMNILNLLKKTSYYFEYQKKSLQISQIYDWKTIFINEINIFKKYI